mmetsp:Transcript_19228/g.56654  ORF Transcript_19228/g.56654 Transcript_19228/m.56654 type:complete len:266 (+) Transcript_19228:557-1354(+)
MDTTTRAECLNPIGRCTSAAIETSGFQHTRNGEDGSGGSGPRLARKRRSRRLALRRAGTAPTTLRTPAWASARRRVRDAVIQQAGLWQQVDDLNWQLRELRFKNDHLGTDSANVEAQLAAVTQTSKRVEAALWRQIAAASDSAWTSASKWSSRSGLDSRRLSSSLLSSDPRTRRVCADVCGFETPESKAWFDCVMDKQGTELSAWLRSSSTGAAKSRCPMLSGRRWRSSTAWARRRRQPGGGGPTSPLASSPSTPASSPSTCCAP